MPLKPFFKFYPSDWIADTRMLSNAAKGLWIDLMCKMAQSDITGVISVDITDVSRLIGENLHESEKLLQELMKGKLLDHKSLGGGMYQLTSRRMVRDAQSSDVKSKAGAKGMASRYQKDEKKKKTVTPNDITPVITEVITNDITDAVTYNNYNSNYNTNSKNNLLEGGTGETFETPGLSIGILTIEECERMYLSPANAGTIDQIAINHQAQNPAITVDVVREWVVVFGKELRQRSINQKTYEDYARHFPNWLRLLKDKTQPEKYFANETGNNNNTGNRQTGNNAHNRASTASTALIRKPGS